MAVEIEVYVLKHCSVVAGCQRFGGTSWFHLLLS